MEWRKLTEEEKAELTRINREKVEQYLSGFSHRSHDLEVLVDYIMDGGQVWHLDTGDKGEDDLLCGDRDEVEEDVIGFYDGEEEEEFELTEISLKASASDMGLWDFVDFLKSLEDGEDE